jgi:hypothetical protein
VTPSSCLFGRQLEVATAPSSCCYSSFCLSMQEGPSVPPDFAWRCQRYHRAAYQLLFLDANWKLLRRLAVVAFLLAGKVLRLLLQLDLARRC